MLRKHRSLEGLLCNEFFLLFHFIGGMKLTVENRSTRRKTCSIATLSTTNPTWTGLRSNPGLRGERSATNRLSHGMAFLGSWSVPVPSFSYGFLLSKFNVNTFLNTVLRLFNFAWSDACNSFSSNSI